jgi:hypothetical protein
MADTRELALRWLVQRKRRWPLSLLVAFGCASAGYLAAVGHGRQLAAARAPASSAALMALQPVLDPAMPDAVPHWKRAHAALSGFDLDSNREVQPFPTPDWHDPASFAADGPIRRLLDGNAAALAAAEPAIGIAQAAWKLDYLQGPGMDLHDLMGMRPLVRLAQLRACVAVHDRDWPTVLRSIRLILAASGHARQGSGIICHLVASSFSAVAAKSVRQAVELLSAPPPDEVLAELSAISAQQRSSSPSLVGVFEFERRQGLMLMDALGSGDFSRTRSPLAEVPGSLPGPLNVYSAIYLRDREVFERIMDQTIAGLRTVEAGGRSSFDPERAFSEDRGLTYLRCIGAPSLSGLLLPASGVVASQQRKIQVEWQVTEVGLGLVAFAATHGRRWPATLDELGLDAERTLDPFDPARNRLHWQRLADGARKLWSVGPNRRDETLTPPASAFSHGDDIVFQLPGFQD